MPDSHNPSSPSSGVDPLYLVTDEPIRHYKHDLLGLHQYADVIAGAALGTRGPFTIGIYGEWGQGKTSLLYHARTLLEHRDPAEPKQFRYPHVIPALFDVPKRIAHTLPYGPPCGPFLEPISEISNLKSQPSPSPALNQPAELDGMTPRLASAPRRPPASPSRVRRVPTNSLKTERFSVLWRSNGYRIVRPGGSIRVQGCAVSMFDAAHAAGCGGSVMRFHARLLPVVSSVLFLLAPPKTICALSGNVLT